MGSPDTDAQAYMNSGPSTKSRSLRLPSRYLITRELYRKLCGTSPEAWQRDSDDNRLPANDVSWFDAMSFCNALSHRWGCNPVIVSTVRMLPGIRMLMAIACRLRPNGNMPAVQEQRPNGFLAMIRQQTATPGLQLTLITKCSLSARKPRIPGAPRYEW